MTTKNIHENIWKKIDAKEQSGDNKKNDWHMNYDLTMRLLGYYNSEEQIMHVETRFPEEAVVLADLFRQTFEKTFWTLRMRISRRRIMVILSSSFGTGLGICMPTIPEKTGFGSRV